MYRVTTRTRKRSVLCVIILRLSLGSCLRRSDFCARIGHGLGTVWAQLRFKDSPLAIFTFGENAVGLDFLRFAKKASW